MTEPVTPQQWADRILFITLGACVGFSSYNHDGTVAGLLIFALVVILLTSFPPQWRNP